MKCDCLRMKHFKEEFTMKELKNREEVIEKLTEMLIDFDKDLNKYQTDVYLYYDDESQTAELDTFVNVGGNSWLNDDHYTIYRDTEHYDGWEDYFCNDDDFAWGLDMDSKKFDGEVCEYLKQQDYEVEEGYEPEWYEKRDYIRTRDDYVDKLIEVYQESIDENRAEYAEEAERIIAEWENEEN